MSACVCLRGEEPPGRWGGQVLSLSSPARGPAGAHTDEPGQRRAGCPGADRERRASAQTRIPARALVHVAPMRTRPGRRPQLTVSLCRPWSPAAAGRTTASALRLENPRPAGGARASRLPAPCSASSALSAAAAAAPRRPPRGAAQHSARTAARGVEPRGEGARVCGCARRPARRGGRAPGRLKARNSAFGFRTAVCAAVCVCVCVVYVTAHAGMCIRARVCTRESAGASACAQLYARAG